MTGVIEVVCVVLWVISGICFIGYLGKPSRYQWFTPLGVFWIFYTLRIQLPSLYVYHATGWSGIPGMYNYPLMVAIAPLFVFIGAIMAGHRGRDAWTLWWRRPLLIRQNARFPGWILFGLGLAVIAAHVVAVRGQVPVLLMFRHIGDPGRLLHLRQEAAATLPLYITYPILWNRELLLPMATVLALVMFLATRKPGMLLLVFPAAAFAAMFTIARGPVTWLLVMLTATYYLITNRRIFSPKIILALVLVISFPLFINIFKFHGILDTAQAARGLWSRTFYGTSWTVGANIAHIQEHGAYLYGRSIGWWARITGQEYYPLAYLVHVQFVRKTTLGMCNTCFVGDSWANFGWFGVIFSSVFVGWWLSTLERLLLRMPRTPIAIAVLVVATVVVEPLVSTGLQVYLMTHGGILLMLVALFLGSRETRYAEIPEQAGDELAPSLQHSRIP